jgi:Serine/Threonine/Tyrosine Kinase found in polyvalent proteins
MRRYCGHVPSSTMAERTREEGASGSLIAAANYIKRRPGAISARGEAVARPIISQRDSLYEYLHDRGEILSERYCRQFHHFGNGAEHEVYFDLEHRRAIKVTRSNNFGWSVAHEGAHATPFEYLRRLIYQNWFFGDAIALVGATGSEGHMEIITSQPWIDADRIRPPATDEQIRTYFAEIGFFESRLYDSGGFFYHPQFNVIAADAHSRNVLVSSDGYIHPIDIVMGRPGSILKSRLRTEFGLGVDACGGDTATTGDSSSTTSILFEGGPTS